MALRYTLQVFFSMIMIFSLSGCLPPPQHTVLNGICQGSPAILDKTTGNDSRKGTMKVLADMEIQTMGRKYPARMAVMVKGPDCLRMEAIPLVGPPDFMLSIKGNHLRVYLPSKGEFYTGEASRNLYRFVPIPIDVRDIVPILMGTYPPLEKGDCFADVLMEGELRRVDVVSKTGSPRMCLWFKNQDQNLARITMADRLEQVDHTIVFSDYTTIDEIAMPQRIVIRRGGMMSISQTITIRYSDMEFSDDTSDKEFELPLPDGVRQVEMDKE
ncbi:MAG: hypothetical protein CSYNP_00621 [Syntrophus sp. SKADARSKE-3]|nr:hypothetical protein [Syntrophus sp. SKADARSKE-3]